MTFINIGHDTATATVPVRSAASADIVAVPGPPGPAGPPGPPGPAGSPSAFYRHVQMTPGDIWLINHNMGFWPSVTVVDSSGRAVIGEVDYLSINTVRLTFSAAFAGESYLS